MVRNVRHIRRSFIIVTVLVLFVTSISLLIAVTQARSDYVPFQETGTIDISIGSGTVSTGIGSDTSISTSTSTSYFPHGGGGYVSCTIISPGGISCATSSTSGGGDEGTSTTTPTETENILTTTGGGNAGGGNANVSSTTTVNSTTNMTSTSVPEYRVAPILLAVTIGLALISLRIHKVRLRWRHHSTTR